MHFERKMTVADDHCFETLSAILDGPFGICSIITDDDGRPADYRFLRVSRSFEETTGFSGVEGRTVLEIVPNLERKWIDHYGRVALDGVPARFSERSEVTGREYEVRAAPLDPPGRFVMVFKDLTELRRLEGEWEAALEHAQHLLKELSHRVMNSFAAISAVVSMEARESQAEGRGALDRVQRRVQALASLYRRLDGASQVDRIAVSDYLGGIVDSFRGSFASTVSVDLAPMTLSTRTAVPLGLVLNELLTNAAKHAFGQERRGRVQVSLAEENGTCCLVVADDGQAEADGGRGGGIGRSLIAAFVGELGGEMTVDSGPHGTRVAVTFQPWERPMDLAGGLQ